MAQSTINNLCGKFSHVQIVDEKLEIVCEVDVYEKLVNYFINVMWIVINQWELSELDDGEGSDMKNIILGNFWYNFAYFILGIGNFKS